MAVDEIEKSPSNIDFNVFTNVSGFHSLNMMRHAVGCQEGILLDCGCCVERDFIDESVEILFLTEDDSLVYCMVVDGWSGYRCERWRQYYFFPVQLMFSFPVG